MNKEEITGKTYNFLKSVSELTKAIPKNELEIEQKSTWMVATHPGVMHSENFRRNIINKNTVISAIQKEIKKELNEYNELEKLITELGVQKDHIFYSFIIPLINKWLDTRNPFEFSVPDISILLSEFSDAVLDKKVKTKSIYAIPDIKNEVGPIELEKGINIHPINKDELWRFGEDYSFPVMQFSENTPTENWQIVDIEILHSTNDYVIIDSILDQLIVAFRLASSGRFHFIHLGEKRNYGINSIGTRYRYMTDKKYGRFDSKVYIINRDVCEKLKVLWPRIKNVMKSPENYLRLPTQRFVDGSSREHHADAILDYAIGLESLLLHNIKSEASYRFALRGATILSLINGKKKEHFAKLKKFYAVRSDIAHGGHVKEDVNEIRLFGETAIRDIWCWYFNQEDKNILTILSGIDDIIQGK